MDFTYHTRPNRVEGGTQPGGGNILPLTRPRLNTVTTETGALTTVTYSAPECVRGSRMPAAEDDNALSCTRSTGTSTARRTPAWTGTTSTGSWR
ncbi:hypothetical protein SCALM49S_02216 [Streptomyces californicus]